MTTDNQRAGSRTKFDRKVTERPNTVAGLLAKRAELIRLREHLESDLRAVTADIDHLEGAILLFNGAKHHLRYVRQYRAKKGSVRRFVLAALRDAEEPLTSRDLTERWCAERGLKTDDATWAILRNRIGACLTGLKNQGLAHGAGTRPDGYKGWVRG
ncbi:MAG TPA: hypothetical protein VKQ70_08480 [Caulobacteraceae bacterium]|nr:hypothetical protein [Caulobacteraceae bacterium]